MSVPARLLVVDDEPDLRTLYELTLLREGHDVESVGTVAEAWQRLQQQSYHLVITDMRLPDGTGLDLLRQLEAAGRPERTLVITAYGSAENAVEALKAGAFDYLTKPVDLRQFRGVVGSALGRPAGGAAGASASARAGDTAGASGGAGEPGAAPGRSAEGQATLDRLSGRTPAMEQVRSLIRRVARGMAPVLVLGESGTGKELVARAIHGVSGRTDQPFVAVNCGAIPEQLLEAEFFGYRKGAFTGATEDRPGFFQAAQGGTLFLDEIGDLPLSMQSKLLRAVQERAVRPIGTTAEVPVSVRIVSATHKDLEREVAEGRFRRDLFYRLNVIQIQVPPLRERTEDLPVICAAVLGRIARDAGVSPAPKLTDAAIARLACHAFPGNVRELENLLHRAVALTGAERIDAADLGLDDDDALDAAPTQPAPLDAWGASSGGGDAATAAGGAVAADDAAVAGHAADLAPARSPVEAPLPDDLVKYLDEVERDVLVRALERHRYNRTAAGASLGLSLRQMRYRMARLGIQIDAGVDAGG